MKKSLEESHLNDTQKYILFVLENVLEIAEKMNLKCYMQGGTMLGAIRHKGFIPWDDDVDLGMMRDDYEYFLKHVEEHLPENMELRTYWDESEHHYYFARIVDNRHLIKRMGSAEVRYENVWVDIFPLDGMPNGGINLLFHKSKLSVARFLYHLSCIKKVNAKRPGRPWIEKTIINIAIRLPVDKLFDMMRMLRDQGISLIYISHKMDEIFEICDDISVLRDGNLVMTKSAKETNMNELITAMVGRVLENRFPPVDNQPKDVILSIQHLSTKYEPYLQDVTFDVREGEIFGLYGLVGAGRTELLETIFGIRTRAAGRVYLNHKLMNFSCAKEAMDYGFALITEERKANGLFLKGNLTFNTTIANLNAYKKGAALSEPKMTKATANEIKVMHTKCLGPNDMISSLSGGNQQKVIFGKWLEREPKVFMMDEPTRGIDVGAKYEIYDLIIQMAKQGKTIIVVSSEMPEILGITNRIGVMSNGRLAGIVNTKETNQEELLRLSAKYL